MAVSEVIDERHAARRVGLVARLLPVVEGLLEEQQVGYIDLSVEDIIRRAHLARSTFYRYFRDKNELLVALSEPALADILDAATAPWNLPTDATRDDLAAGIRRAIEAYRPHVTLMAAMVEAAAYDPAVKQRFDDGFAAVRAAVAARIRDGQQRGLIRPGLPPEETAAWITWMAERGMAQLVPSAQSEEELGRMEQALTGIVWHTFYGS